MIRTYIDSGILIAAWRSQGPAICSKARQIISDWTNREYVSSDYFRIEVLPSAIYTGIPGELQIIGAFLAQVTETFEVTKSGYEDAFKLASKYGLKALDELQIQSAIDASADVFITNEKKSKPFFRVTEISVKQLQEV